MYIEVYFMKAEEIVSGVKTRKKSSKIGRIIVEDVVADAGS